MRFISNSGSTGRAFLVGACMLALVGLYISCAQVKSGDDFNSALKRASEKGQFIVLDISTSG